MRVRLGMGDVSAEPSMEDILSSIKRIIAEEGDAPARARKAARGRPAPEPQPVELGRRHVADDDAGDDEILELDDSVAMPQNPAAPRADGDRPASSTPVRDAILSNQAAEASRGALEALSRMVVKPETAGTDTLEGLVRELLRPMLRDWLDAHLPEMVEQMVAREIARITSQAD